MSRLEEFRRQEHTRGRGCTAEEDGVRWLREHGYRILDRNVSYRAGELDVVALDGDTLCFVEIKARATAAFGQAAAAVTPRKQRQIAAAASLYLAQHSHAVPCRFDVLAMDGRPDGWRYTLIRGAFEVS